MNLSPKGPIGSLQVTGEREVAYLDVVGSGAETIAHLRENGRIVVMLCAFSGPPRIVRLHGRGTVLTPDEPRFAELLAAHDFAEPQAEAARRSIVVVDVNRISDSCGYGVPLMDHVGERDHADLWAAKKLRTGGPRTPSSTTSARRTPSSLDGLPAARPTALDLQLVLEQRFRGAADAVVNRVSSLVVRHREPGDERGSVAAGDVGDGPDQRVGVAGPAG